MKYWIKNSLRDAAWAPASIMALSFVLGTLLKGYLIFPGLDKLFHIAGGMAITYFFCVSILHAQKLFGPVPLPKRLVLAQALTGCTAISWELMELAGDRLFQTRMNYGLADTLLDVLFGLLGAMIMVLMQSGGMADKSAGNKFARMPVGKSVANGAANGAANNAANAFADKADRADFS